LRIALLSTDGRADIVDGFVKFAERNWPDRKWPYEVIAGDPEGSYSQRIISYLKSVPDEVLMMCIDDFWPLPSVDQAQIDRAYEYILKHKNIGAIHLLHCVSTEPSCTSLPGFKFIGVQDSDRSSEGAFLLRRKYMLEVTETIGARLSAVQDAGIVGMTYWETNANQVGAKWDILCPEPTNSVFPRINACCEAQWRKDTFELVRSMKIDVDMSKRQLWDGQSPHGDILKKLDWNIGLT